VPAEDGGFVIDFPDLGGYSQGDDEEDARSMALDLLRTLVEDRMRRSEAIPAPRKYRGSIYRDIVLPVSESAKVELYIAMSAKGVSRLALAKRLGLSKREMESLLDLSSPTTLQQIERAYEFLNLKVQLTVRPAA